MSTKICRECKEEKPVEGNFTRKGAYKGKEYYHPDCNPCRQFIRNGRRPSVERGLRRSKDSYKPTDAQTITTVGNRKYKTCFTCKSDKPLSEFRTSNKTRTGYQGTCKACEYKQKRQWEKDNPERHKEGDRRRHKKYISNPDNREAKNKHRREWRKSYPDAVVIASLYRGQEDKDRPYDIPKELIDAHRELIKLRGLIRAVRRKNNPAGE